MAAVGAPASAHTQLIGVDPAEGATVAMGDAVTLSFSEDLLSIGAGATVTDAAGEVTTLDVTFPTPASAQVIMPVVPGGALTLAWRVVAGDGHPVEGTIAYVADAPAPTSESPTPATAAETEPSAAASASPDATAAAASPTPPGDQGASNNGAQIAVAAALFAALLASGFGVFVRRRRR